MVQAKIREMYASETEQGIRMFSGGIDLYDVEQLSQEEADAVRYCFEKNVKMIENVSPKLAASIRPQREAFVKWASIAKGTFPETKNFTYPGQIGGLGVDFLNPQLYKYDTSPSTTNPSYTDYTGNTWNISLTADTIAYIAGDATYHYKGSPITNNHSFAVIAQDGIVELGSTPKITQMKFESEALDKYTPIAMSPLMIESIEENKTIYQYNTPGMIPLSHQHGMRIEVLPNATGTATIPLIGMVFYEYEFFPMAARSGTFP